MECPACHSQNIDGARFCAKCGALLPANTSTEQDPLIGSVVGGRFRIVDVLGEGGMGRVYRGEQQMGTSVRQVAVKTLLAQYAKDPQVLARFMRECGTVSELEHPNTIKVYDFGQTPSGELYIAMELLTGKSLELVLETQGALPPERVDRIVAQVCGSLQEAHDKGIVHRDLKPANIQLSLRAGEDDYVKVLDFGIAKRDERTSKSEQKLTQQGTVLGTPPYMSPEQFKGQELDSRSDIYSLGVMTYEMLTGRLPFDADTPWAWATQHMTAQPFPFETVPMGATVPPKMKAAVMRALQKDKNLRQSSVREFYTDLSLGAARPSMLGLGGRGPSGSFPDTPLAGAGGAAAAFGTANTGVMQSRPGQTQIGEPLFVTGPQPAAGRTMIDQGPVPAALQAMQPMQQIPSHSMMAAHAHPTTGSGQAFPVPAPPAATQTKKNPGPMIAIAAAAGIAAIVGGILLFRKPADEGTDSVIPVPTGPTAVAVPSDPVPSAGPSETSAAADTSAPPSTGTAGATGATGATGTGQTKGVGASTAGTATAKPAGGSDEECQAAMRLAAGGHTINAVNHFRQCNGPSKASAKAAIDASATRAVSQRGCAAKADVQAASSIGASGAMSAYKAKKCS